MKAVVAAFNQEKALVGAFSVITNLRMDFFEALVVSSATATAAAAAPGTANYRLEKYKIWASKCLAGHSPFH